MLKFRVYDAFREQDVYIDPHMVCSVIVKKAYDCGLCHGEDVPVLVLKLLRGEEFVDAENGEALKRILAAKATSVVCHATAAELEAAMRYDGPAFATAVTKPWSEAAQ